MADRTDPNRERQPDRPWYEFANLLLPSRESAGRWVDIGCGRGELIDLAGQSGHAGMGLDLDGNGLRDLRKAGHPVLVADLGESLPFRDAALDGATFVEVIEHIVHAEDLLSELARVIRPGGWIVISTPNVAHLTYRVRAVTGHPPKQEGYHYRFFTRKTLAKALVDAGFVPDDTASFGKNLVRSKWGRLMGRGSTYKARYRVPRRLEALLAQHFVWRFRRGL